MEQLELELKTVKDLRIEELEEEIDKLNERIRDLEVEADEWESESHGWQERADDLYTALNEIRNISRGLL